jgi:hypothetical protein
VSGDRRGDVVGFGPDGVWVAQSLGNGGFTSASRAVSASISAERGCPYGNAATPTQKSPSCLTSRTSSSLVRMTMGSMMIALRKRR